MDEEDDWVLVRCPADKDLWSPSLVEEESEDTSQALKVTFAAPAKYWTDAIPIGTGRLGAMVWGGVASELIQLNEDTLWTGTPGNYANPNAPEALAEVRKLVDAGKYSEATDAAVKLSDNSPDVYQPLGDIKLEFNDSHIEYDTNSYQRELDLDTATVKVKYSVGDVEFTREHFASCPDQVIATKISGSISGSVSFMVYLDSKLEHNSHVNGGNQIIMEGTCPGKRSFQKVNADDNPKGIRFSSILDVQISNGNGTIHVIDDTKLKVEGSDWAVLLLVASSSFEGPFTKSLESRKDPDSESQSMMKSVKTFSYSDLYAHHLDDYQKLFHRVSLKLSKPTKRSLQDGPLNAEKYMSKVDSLCSNRREDITVPTAERVKVFPTDEDPSLVELLFQYGRYLLISCSRPGTQVANLQGIWNNKTDPPWDSAQHLNINLQMNYWPSLCCNLRECQEPLFDYMSSLSINGSKTARVNYEASGWVAHQVSDLWAKTSTDKGLAVWALWPMGGAWLCTHLWEYYMYTLDKDFLKNKAYPLLEGCVFFLLDWLVEGRGGYLETNPSTSPEHMFIAPDGKQASVSYSSTMDMAIIKEVFSSIVSAAEVLEKSDDKIVQRVREAQPKLPPTKIARDGSIMEWAQDFEDPEVHHRHVSHLFGLYPGHTITVEKTPELCKAADYTLYKRGDEGPGWSTMWKTALWARLRNSEHAYRMVKRLFILVDPDHESDFEGGLYSNLFTAHPPFQIDANFGFAAAIAEMLVQSTQNDLYLLPALPREKWGSGCVKGLKARGGVTISISWSEGDLHEIGVWCKEKNALKRLHYRGTTVEVNILAGKVYTFNRQLKCVKSYSC